MYSFCAHTRHVTRLYLPVFLFDLLLEITFELFELNLSILMQFASSTRLTYEPLLSKVLQHRDELPLPSAVGTARIFQTRKTVDPNSIAECRKTLPSSALPLSIL